MSGHHIVISALGATCVSIGVVATHAPTWGVVLVTMLGVLVTGRIWERVLDRDSATARGDEAELRSALTELVKMKDDLNMGRPRRDVDETWARARSVVEKHAPAACP